MYLVLRIIRVCQNSIAFRFLLLVDYNNYGVNN